MACLFVRGGFSDSWQKMDMSRSTAVGAAQDVSEDNEPPEQPIVERDPSGRWSRVRTTSSFVLSLSSYVEEYG